MSFKSPILYLTLATVLFFVEAWIYNTAEASYNQLQIRNLTDARNVGSTFLCFPTLRQKDKCFDQTLMAISLQESSAGIEPLGDDGKSYGLNHVTVPAARHVEQDCKKRKYMKICGFLRFPITDDDLIIRLASDNYFNLLVSATYFRIQLDKQKRLGNSLPYSRALINYNCGSCADTMSEEKVWNNKYRIKIMIRIKSIKTFNYKHRVWI